VAILLHHADAEGVSSKGCFCGIERNPVGSSCGGFVLYMGCRHAERMNLFLNVVTETTGAQPVVLYFIILPSMVLN
jgi:hypothetical protein